VPHATTQSLAFVRACSALLGNCSMRYSRLWHPRQLLHASPRAPTFGALPPAWPRPASRTLCVLTSSLQSCFALPRPWPRPASRTLPVLTPSVDSYLLRCTWTYECHERAGCQEWPSL